MNNRLTVNYENKPAYDIVMKSNFEGLAKELHGLSMENRKLMIITDSNVGAHYASQVMDALKSVSNTICCYTIPAGEANKNLDTVNHCYEELILQGFDRNDVLIALGGGVVGDLTGFVGATYLRGIRFIQVPTSLLSMVDSSIGGKTGVDFKAYKNMVGAFYQPQLVYMNLSVLTTLPDAEYFSGMGEIIKHGLIKDITYYNWLKNQYEQIALKDLETLKEMIYRSCQIKKEVVEADPKEQGERATLNFGHTIGHSIEKLMNFSLLHGECVSLGMAGAAFISKERGNISDTDYNDILRTIQLFHQPIHVAGLSVEEVYEVTKLDKKMDAAKIKFILLSQIGTSVIDTTVSPDEMKRAIQSVLKL